MGCEGLKPGWLWFILEANRETLCGASDSNGQLSCIEHFGGRLERQVLIAGNGAYLT